MMDPSFSPLLIQTIQSSDATTLKDIRLRALKDSPNAFGSVYEEEANQPASFWQGLIDGLQPDSGNIGLFLMKQTDPVGLIFGFDRGQETASLGGMWIDPAFRQLGYASTLIQTIIDWARQSGKTYIQLWHVEGNMAAERLYEKCGFHPTGICQPLPGREDHMIYQYKKNLSSSLT